VVLLGVLSETEVYRRWLVFAALLPYAVPCDHRAEREAFERQRSRERAAQLLAIPLQRAPSEPRRRPTTARSAHR
jgi:hypothetical protein